MTKEDLKQKLREKLSQKKFLRSNKKVKQGAMDKQMKEMGIDRKEFEKSVKVLKESGVDIQSIINKGIKNNMDK